MIQPQASVNSAKIEKPCPQALILKSLVVPGCCWGVGVDLGLEQLGKTQQVIPILKANRHHATQNYCSKNTAVNGQQVVAWLSHAYSFN